MTDKFEQQARELKGKRFHADCPEHMYGSTCGVCEAFVKRATDALRRAADEARAEAFAEAALRLEHEANDYVRACAVLGNDIHVALTKHANTCVADELFAQAGTLRARGGAKGGAT